MFDRVLNMPLDYLNCFAMMLRGIHDKVDSISQTDYSIYSKLIIFPYSEVIYGSTTFKLTKGLQSLEKNDQLFNLMFCSFFHFLCFNVPDSKCHKQKWRVLFFTRIKLEACGLECTHVIALIKWRRLLRLFQPVKFLIYSK